MAEKPVVAVPAGLGPAGVELWHRVADEFVLPEHMLSVLLGACHLADRAVQAREVIAREGLLSQDNHGNWKEHPAVSIERASLAGMQRALKCLHVDLATGEE